MRLINSQHLELFLEKGRKGKIEMSTAVHPLFFSAKGLSFVSFFTTHKLESYRNRQLKIITGILCSNYSDFAVANNITLFVNLSGREKFVAVNGYMGGTE